jgi:hypothetical protein
MPGQNREAIFNKATKIIPYVKRRVLYGQKTKKEEKIKILHIVNDPSF